MQEKKVKKSIYITRQQDRLLKELSDKTGAPEAVYIRRALDAYLKQQTEN